MITSSANPWHLSTVSLCLRICSNQLKSEGLIDSPCKEKQSPIECLASIYIAEDWQEEGTKGISCPGPRPASVSLRVSKDRASATLYLCCAGYRGCSCSSHSWHPHLPIHLRTLKFKFYCHLNRTEKQKTKAKWREYWLGDLGNCLLFCDMPWLNIIIFDN